MAHALAKHWVTSILESVKVYAHRGLAWLTHWGRVTHICVGKLSIIGSDNGLSPDRCQAIIWTNAGILLIGTLGTNFIEISIEIYTFSFKKMRLKMSSGKWRPCCLGLNVLTHWGLMSDRHQQTGSSLLQVMAWQLLGAKPLPESVHWVQTYCWVDWTPRNHLQWNLKIKI